MALFIGLYLPSGHKFLAMKPIKGGKHPGKDVDAAARTLAGIFENIASGRDFPEPPNLPWSEMLIELVQPYMTDVPEIEELEEKLELAQISWNMAVMKKRDEFFYHNYRNNFLAKELDPKMQQLVDNLVKDKEAKFGVHEVMLDDCEIIDDEEGEAMVNVTAKSYEQFMHDVFVGVKDEDDDYDDDDDDFEDEEIYEEAAYVNRSAIAVIPKKPFYDWVRNLFANDEPPADLDQQKTLYLVKTLEKEAQFDEWLQKNFEKLFINELQGWHEDESEWPETKSLELFKEWFDVEFCSMVYDIETAAITKI